MTEFECSDNECLELDVWPIGEGEALFEIVSLEGKGETVKLTADQTRKLIKLLRNNLND